MEIRPPEGTLPGEWVPPTGITFDTPNYAAQRVHIQVPSGVAYTVPNLFTEDDCQRLIDIMMQQRLAPVSVSGHQTADPGTIGSVRATAWSPELGNAF